MQTSPTDDRLDYFSLQVLVAVVVAAPLLLLILLFLSDLNLSLGRALGLNLPQDERLQIYDVSCDNLDNFPIIYITYWIQESAPLQVQAGDFYSEVLTSPAGLNQITLSYRDRGLCPEAIILHDLSRNFRSGATVEQLQ
jgi:hypothetical protein